MIVNFRICGISRGACKLVRILTLNQKKKPHLEYVAHICYQLNLFRIEILTRQQLRLYITIKWCNTFNLLHDFLAIWVVSKRLSAIKHCFSRIYFKALGGPNTNAAECGVNCCCFYVLKIFLKILNFLNFYLF